MPEEALSGGADRPKNTLSVAMPAIFRRRPVAVWLVIGALLIFLILSFGLFFEAVAPVAPFWFQPYVQADSGAYWELSGVRSNGVVPLPPDGQSSGSELGNNTLGPVGQARIFRTDFGILISNLALLGFVLWIVGTMKEFDRATFTLLLMLNPLLFAAVTTLNKEIFAIAGIVLYVRYMTAKRYRGLLLMLALMISFAARWQQTAIMLVLACIESRFSPIRGKPVAGVIAVLLMFTVAYAAVFHAAPVLIAGLLAQAQAGHTIVILDNIQGNLGFPLVVIPKIMLNVMGRFITPSYFLGDYWTENFANWYDQIFTQAQELLTTLLLLGLLIAGKLKLKDPAVYLLVLYLILTAVNPMVQPRYEYPAYVLLCLQASKFFRLGGHKRDTIAPAGESLNTHIAASPV